jgi:hypothetical protein
VIGAAVAVQQIRNSLLRSQMVSLEFFIYIKSFRPNYGPGVDSASNRNEYQEHFLGIKAAGAYSWQPYHHPVPLLRNLGTLTSWDPLGLSRPVTGLLYYLVTYIWQHWQPSLFTICTMSQHCINHERRPVSSLCCKHLVSYQREPNSPWMHKCHKGWNVQRG